MKGDDPDLLKGLIAYDLPILGPEKAQLEIEIPLDSGARNVGRVALAFRKEMRAFHDALPKEEQLPVGEFTPVVYQAPVIGRLSNVAFRGPLWLPRAARDKGMIVLDGQRLYEQKLAERRQVVQNRNPYTKPVACHHGYFLGQAVVEVVPNERYL